MDCVEFGRLIRRNAKRLGIEPIVFKPTSHRRQAQHLRKINIDINKYSTGGPFYNIEEREQDRKHNLRAYEIMSDAQILLSEKRFIRMRQKEVNKFLRNYKEFQERSRHSKFEVRACA